MPRWCDWLKRTPNLDYVSRLRELLVRETTPVFIFLGAGLSYGVDRGRAMFEHHEYEDNSRFPSWTQLVGRMQKQLLTDPILEPHQQYVERFFKEEGPLDCAELFRHYIQEPNYWDFLRRQFGSMPDDHDRLTRSHHALQRLPVKHLFTTNYDELIELTYRIRSVSIRVSSSSQEFIDNMSQNDQIHFVKLHGTIQSPSSVVLTRSDYARSRKERALMFQHLLDRFQYSTFLFVGFSLTDPNFNILYDEARYVRQNQQPVSYVVQGRQDPIRDAYLRSLGVNSITLDYWEQLPSFLEVINPGTDLTPYLSDTH